MTHAGRTTAAPLRSEQGATQCDLGASAVDHLRRIAALHADQARLEAALANAYDDLARDVEIGLAAFANQSVHALVPEPEFLTAKGVADLLQVAPRTVRRMALDGRLPAPVEITGSRRRWRRADVVAHFRSPTPEERAR